MSSLETWSFGMPSGPRIEAINTLCCMNVSLQTHSCNTLFGAFMSGPLRPSETTPRLLFTVPQRRDITWSVVPEAIVSISPAGLVTSLVLVLQPLSVETIHQPLDE